MAKSEGSKPLEKDVSELKVSVDTTKPRKVRITADRVSLIVNELTIVAGVIRVIRNAPIPDAGEAAVIFDELNADEYTMRYAD